MTQHPDNPLTAIAPLSTAVCFDRLRQNTLGRVAMSWEALPEIFPVQYALLGSDPVFRTIPGHQLMQATHGQVLCLAIDSYDPDLQVGWRVLVTGPAQRLTDASDLAAASALPLKPWTGNQDGFVRIEAARVRGTEIRDPGPTGPLGR